MAENNYNRISNNYETPPLIYEAILKFIKREKFDIDFCCSRFNIPAHFHYMEDGVWEFTKHKNKYIKPYIYMRQVAFMNPPFQQAKAWTEKAFYEVNREANKNTSECWCVLPADRLNTVFFQELLSENENWFMAVIKKDKTQILNFRNPLFTDEQNAKNLKNGGLNTPIMILYIGNNSSEYAQRWRKEQPLKSLVMVGI